MRRSIVLALLLATGQSAFAGGPPCPPRKGAQIIVPKTTAATTPAKPGHFELVGPETNLLDRLPYVDMMNPHAAHMPPTVQDAIRVLGVAHMMSDLFGAKDPYARLLKNGGAMTAASTLVQLAHANGQSLEWVSRNLPYLLGWETRPAAPRQATAAELELFHSFNPEEKQLH